MPAKVFHGSIVATLSSSALPMASTKTSIHKKIMLQLSYQHEFIEAGIDEAGRGCYAGPVFAAAVILPTNFHHPLLNDSKQVKEHHRNQLRLYIEENALAFGIGIVDENEIDHINILQATYKAMHLAVAQLKIEPQILLVDGNRFKPYQKTPHKCIIKGDATYMHIAAASILAKTHRDEYMLQLHHQFPQYDWINNKGYGTASHRKAIEQFGLCKYHRKSFNILPGKLLLF